MAKKKLFDKILKKRNYTKDEVEEILLGTYEGFTAGFIEKHPKAIKKAKQSERTRIRKYIHQQFRQGKFMLVEKKRYKGKTTDKDLDKWWGF